MAEGARAIVEMKVAVRAIEWARDNLELTTAEIGAVLGTTERTVIRWSNRECPPSRRHREAIEQLNELRLLLTDMFGDHSSAVLEWLHDSLPALRGRSPMSFLLKGELADVIGLLATHYSGAFV
jgi:hypothetical protein